MKNLLRDCLCAGLLLFLIFGLPALSQVRLSVPIQTPPIKVQSKDIEKRLATAEARITELEKNVRELRAR